MKILGVLKALVGYMRGLRENSTHNKRQFADLINWTYSKYREWEINGTDVKMSRFLKMCRVHKKQPSEVMRVLEAEFDFTEPDSEEWGD